jgi:hypothetical protein
MQCAAARDALFVEGHHEDAAPGLAPAHVDRAEEGGCRGNGAVRDPRRLLARENEGVAVLAGDAVGLRSRSGAELVLEVDHVAAVIGLGDGPAADDVGAAEALDQRLVPGHRNHRSRKARDAEADGEAGVSPAELLADHRAKTRAAGRIERARGIAHLVEAELPVAPVGLPQRRGRRDHVGRVGHAVELYADRAHHLARELADGIENRALLVTKIEIELHQTHDVSSGTESRDERGAPPMIGGARALRQLGCRRPALGVR